MVEKELNQIWEKVELLSTKVHNFLFGRIYFAGHDGSQNFLDFAPMFNSLTLDNSKKVTNGISIGASPEKIKPFDATHATMMSNLANAQLSRKFNKSVVLQKYSSLLYSNFILNLHIVYELKNWPSSPSNYFALKIVYLVQWN